MTPRTWTLLALAPLALAACGDKDDEGSDDDGTTTVCYDEELDSEPDVDIASPRLDGDDFAGICDGTLMGDDAPDYGYTWVVPRTSGYTITTQGSSYDSVLFVLDEDCNGDVLACNDDIADDNSASQVYVELEEGQTVIIVVDGYDAYATGTGTLSIYEDM